MQQRNAAATSLYDQPADGGSHHNAGPASDAGDAVMARWLQSAGLQHLASPVANNGIDQRLLPNILMQVCAIPVYVFNRKQCLFALYTGFLVTVINFNKIDSVWLFDFGG